MACWLNAIAMFDCTSMPLIRTPKCPKYYLSGKCICRVCCAIRHQHMMYNEGCEAFGNYTLLSDFIVVCTLFTEGKDPSRETTFAS
jgi:hypothetical protein